LFLVKLIGKIKPKEALEKLIEGNKRFTSGVRAVEPLLSHLKMAELSEKGQTPFAIILTCSDSRSPVEMIFDQGLGDLFVVRVAGNIVAPSLLASIEFAAANFGSSLVVVLGHTKCGAVNATIKHVQSPAEPLPSANLEELVSRIRPAVEMSLIEKKSELSVLDKSINQNVRRSMHIIQEQSKIISNLVETKKIEVVGGVLDIATGVVKFFL
jgi:carbonic anhydrase